MPLRVGLSNTLSTALRSNNVSYPSRERSWFMKSKGIELVPPLRFKEFKGSWLTNKLETTVKSMDSGWSPQCDSDPSGLGEWGVLKTTAVVWEGFDEGQNKKLPDSLSPRHELEVLVNDILITRAGPTSRVGVAVHVDSVRSNLMISDKLIRFRINKSNCSKYISILIEFNA